MAFRKKRVAVFLLAISVLILLRQLPGLWASEKSKPVQIPVEVPLAAPEAPPPDSHYEYPSHPVSGFIPLPDPSTLKNPRVQYDFKTETPGEKTIRQERLAKIKEATLHAWKGYRSQAWLKDELSPVSGGHRTSLGGWAATLVDSLDTLWLMGLHEEFDEAVQAVATIDFETSATLPINVFETTIRYLGGLMGAYDVSDAKYPILLQKAQEVGEMLYPAFDTPNRMPVTRWSKIEVEVAGADASVAELGTLSLEFTRLTQLTGDARFYDAVQRITDCFESQQRNTRVPGLFPHTVNARNCWFADGVTFSIGGSADSVYEYFPKEHQLLQGATGQYKTLYQTARKPLKEVLLARPSVPNDSGKDLLLAGTYKSYVNGRTEFIPETHHLACFAGGMFALASRLFEQPEDLETAKSLVNGCIWAYNQTETGIMPERFQFVTCPDKRQKCNWDEHAWNKHILRHSSELSSEHRALPETERLELLSDRLRLPKGMSDVISRQYYLRPEAIESIFVLYRITGDETLRESAWTMFENLIRHTKTEYGFSTIEDVTTVGSAKLDRMESFWIAETLKYFYLLFEDPGVVSLDDFVFNTEAHPFRVGNSRS